MIIFALLFGANLGGGSSKFLLVVAPEWLGYPSAASVIAAADGAIVREGRMSSIAVGFSEDPLFRVRLAKQGAFFVIGLQNLVECGRRI